jgi:DNA (cytosine-5)-methyltransferase 1
VAAWRILDAQWFGVAQRRRRVFVLVRRGAGAWSAADALLPLAAGLSGDPPARGEAGESIAPCLAARTGGGGGLGTDAELDGALIPEVAKGPDSDTKPGHLIPVAISLEQVTSPQNRSQPGEQSPPLTQRNSVVAFKASHYTRGKDGAPAETTPPLSADADRVDQDSLIAGGSMAVRHLTPVECERLMGLPDHYTLVPYRGRPAADSPRYRALGNSMAVPVIRWLGRRLLTTFGE